MVVKRLPYAFVLASLLFSCSKKDSDKKDDAVTPPTEPRICTGLADGAEAICEEQRLEKLTIKADSLTLKVGGAPLLLTLEGTDQSGQRFIIDNNQATWTSSSDQITISADGHVTALGSATDVIITAVVKDLSAELKITVEVMDPAVPSKNCEDTLHGATKEFPRYKKALVNFQSACEPYQALALCDNGQFVFKAEDSVTECRVAVVKEFTVSPQALSLKGGESQAITAEAVDETGFKGTLQATDLSLTVEAAADDQDKITVSDGIVALSADLAQDAEVKVQYRDFTQTITLAKVKIEPTRIAFEKETYLLKTGDTLDLRILAFAGDKPVALDTAKLLIESSDPAKVQIENAVARVLTPGASVTLTAKYDGISAQTQLNIEEELKLVTLGSKKDALIAEKPWVVAALQLKVEGPASQEAPRVTSADEVCSFAVYLSRGQWVVDVKLQDAAQVIPASCQAEVSVESAAGQKAEQAVNVPVRYVALNFKEFLLKDATQVDNVIASLSHKLSSNIKIIDVSVAAHTAADLTPSSCKLSAVQKEGTIEVLADITADPNLAVCAGFLTVVLDIDGKKQSVREQVTVSAFRPFRELCEDKSNQALQKTIKAMSDALSLRKDCQLLDGLLRKKNSESLYRNAIFTLSMASHDLTDLEPLARFTGLRELILTDNPELSDLRPLAALKSLQRIDLEFTKVTDFSPLYKLDAMKLFFSDAEKIDCKKSEVTNKPLKNLCTQE
jgi:hypothetical protein